jgi:hypothetical protein
VTGAGATDVDPAAVPCAVATAALVGGVLAAGTALEGGGVEVAGGVLLLGVPALVLTGCDDCT